MAIDSQLPAPSAQLIQTEIGSPPPTTEGRQTLPEDLLRQASRRLGIACLIIAGLWIANLLMAHVIQPAPVKMPDVAILRLFNVMGAIEIPASLGLWWYSRRARRDPGFLLNLGLVYEVLIALSIGILDWAYNMPMGISWIAIVILLFSAVIPSTPRKTLVTALLAASMDPVGALIWKAAGQEIPGIDVVLINAFPSYLCALIAPLISHIIRGLGREVRKAREMGSYVLGDRIGAGGMGEVWQATHRFLARPAAIKLIKPDVLGAMTKAQGDVLVQRFRREAQAAAMLRSPHTIHLYDFGVTSDGTFYYVMELLNGMDLQTLVSKHGPLPPARVIYLLRQACESLAEAHQRGLVHRDIKPGNIQVCRLGEYSDWVKVLDFGLVKSQGGERLEPGLTAPHSVTGTPAYLSPESALGEPVDQRTDIYALGCVAYWMLTGRYVFTGDSAMQIVARHVSSEPAPPSKHSSFDVSPALDRVVLACLAKKPTDRPGTARELSDQLGECAAESAWTREDARLWWETRMAPEALVALLT
ncbi:MAG TPA: serine/threonine-protein kinase [Gemmatimonadales bacterium]|jgi:serine/threonine-protein kinase